MSLFSSSFPYYQDDNSPFSLKCLELSNDNTKYEIIPGRSLRRFTSINEPTKLLATYIDNNDAKEVVNTPLLLKFPNDSNKMKLILKKRLDGRFPFTNVIVFKTTESDLAEIRDKMLSEDYDIKNYSEIEAGDLKSDENSFLTIRDEFAKELFNNKRLTITIWGTDQYEDITLLIKFSVWIDYDALIKPLPPVPVHSLRSSKTNITNSTRQSTGGAFDFSIEDGPLFRSTVEEYEKKLPIFKHTLAELANDCKNLDKVLLGFAENRKNFNKHFDGILNLKIGTRYLYRNSLRSAEYKLDEVFLDHVNKIFDDLERKLRTVIHEVFSFGLLNDLVKHNNNLALQKKQFENESKDYYSWLNKYLTATKDKDLKLLNKKKAFELTKFDYLDYLFNVVNNPYTKTLLSNIVKYVQSESPRMDFSYFYRQVDEMERLAFQKRAFRKEIDTSANQDELSQIIRDRCFSGTRSVSDPKKLLESIEMNTKSPSDVKEGILYVLGGQGKQGWHKHWVVLNGGVLTEYSDWRKGQSQVDTPINIALCSIKPVIQDKRKYCFEIYTATGSKHVFQAIHEAERDDWIKALYSAGQNINVADVIDSSALPGSKDLAKSAKNGAESRISLPGASTLSFEGSSSSSSKEKDYLQIVQSVDKSNYVCAECGSMESVDWISINFLVVFCVKCSSCHRNLGSHISKIKSLRLDNFVDETEYLLYFINNRKTKEYLEANLPPLERIKENASDAERLLFIKNKYDRKKYALRLEKPSEELLKAAKKQNITDVLKDIACGGDVNMTILLSQNGSTSRASLYEYSLRKPWENSSLFVLSELLILNGAKVGTKVNKGMDISDRAEVFWKSKLEKLHGITDNPTSIPTKPSAVSAISNIVKSETVVTNASTSTSSGKRLLDTFKKKR